MSYPTYSKLKEFIKSPRTICEIRDKFNQKYDSNIIERPKPGCKVKTCVLAYDINPDFFRYLQSFMKLDEVICYPDMLHCIMVDECIFKSNKFKEFIPIILCLKKE
tara:strand:- start:157 stop:474 length:318 start_codon:yes stop_codon:yes gene_type:complete